MKLGDQVRYAQSFLRSISCYAGPMAHAVGTVVCITESFGGGGHALVSVCWHGVELPVRILECNLTVKGSKKALQESYS
jgi:hypothetical protein